METRPTVAYPRPVRLAPSRQRALLTLLVVGAFTSVDSQALGLTLQSIKTDLHLSDTQLGFLTGMAFALFYSVMGLPLARCADRGNRVTIIALCTALYGTAVALCGAASTFLQLMLIRIGVAVGETGYFPAANSLLADYFGRLERPRATAISLLGAPLSVLVGYLLVGWLNESYGWRLTFLLLGAPGPALAVITSLTLYEPRVGQRQVLGRLAVEGISSSLLATGSSMQPSLREVAVTLCSKRTFRHILFGFSVLSFFGGGVAQWQAAFLIRSFALSTGAIGTWLTVIYGFGGLIGMYCSGHWASRHAAGDERRQLNMIALACAGSGVISALVYVSPDQYWAFAFMALSSVGFAIITAPLMATLQTLMPERMRAVSVALLYLFSNLIGMGFGPLAVGVLSDALRPALGEESLRYALLMMTPGYLWVGWHLAQAGRAVVSDVADTA